MADLNLTDLRERACLEVADHAHVAVRKDELLVLLDEIERLRAEYTRAGASASENFGVLERELAEANKRTEAWKYNHGVAQQAFYDVEKERDAARADADRAHACVNRADIERDAAIRERDLHIDAFAAQKRERDQFLKERDEARADADRWKACDEATAAKSLADHVEYKQRRNEQFEAHEKLAAERDVLNAQLDATRNAIGAECVEHVKLSGHIDIAEQCRDWLCHEMANDPSGKQGDFVGALRIVIDQLDRQRRRANWYEASYTAGKQKLIESAVDRALSRARAAAQVYAERVDALGLAADDNDPLVMATAGPIAEAQADLYAVLGLLDRSESGDVSVKPPTETVEQLRAERDAARMLAEVRGRERDQVKEQLADANQQVSDLSDQMQSMVEQAQGEHEETEKDRAAIRLGTEALESLNRVIAKQDAELARLNALINTPRTDEFFESVRIEAAHQVERWGVEHDAGKRPEDWITLFIYLLGKAAKAHFEGRRAKLEHHVITVAAVALNWHRAMTGVSTAMRPGVAPRDVVTKTLAICPCACCAEHRNKVAQGRDGHPCHCHAYPPHERCDCAFCAAAQAPAPREDIAPNETP